MTETLFVSNKDYDYHSLLKVAEINGYLGNIRVYDAEGGYMVVIRDCKENAAKVFERRLINLTENVWGY